MTTDLNKRQFTDRVVADVKHFLDWGEVPRGGSKARFEQTWRGFHIGDHDELIHTESQRQVVSHGEIIPLLSRLYAQPSYKAGRDRFHARILDKYLGVSREDVMTFLHHQETWQLSQPTHKLKTRQVVLSNRPLDHMQIDLIDFSKYSALNNGDHWILTCVDLFSKHCWALPIKTKHAKSVAKALRQIVDDPVMAGRTPKIVQSDNGTEFKEEVSSLLASRRIKQIFSKSYSPWTNGAVERFNGTLKRAIMDHMAQFDTAKWNDVLPELTRGYNQSKHSVTRARPVDLLDPAATADVLASARQRIHAAARRRLDARSFPLISVGDTVRLSARTDSEVRRMELLGQSKGKVPNWSKELYTVVSISEPSSEALTLPQYRVSSAESKEAVQQRFYRNDLQRIDPELLMVNETNRPDYSHGVIFDQEKHLRKVRTRQSAAAEQRPRRERSKPEVALKVPRRRPRRRTTKDKPLYDVAEVMEEQAHGRQRLYRVRWEGYPAEEDWTWQTAASIRHTPAFEEWRARSI